MSIAGQSSGSLARQRVHDRKKSGSLERSIVRVESILIALQIAAIAYADWLTGSSQSLGFLYLVPLSYSALTYNRWVVVGLWGFCMVLRQWLSPLELSPDAFFIRDLVLTGIFFSVVFLLARLGRERRRFFETAREQRDELFREVEMAAEVQDNVLNRNRPPETAYDIDARLEPAKVVGGDYYDFIPIGDSQLGIVVADVAGKGLAAALLMPAVSATVRAAMHRDSSPAGVLTQLDRMLYERTGQSNYATVFCALLDMPTGRLRYACGGHPPPLLIRAADGAAERLDADGTPPGLLPSATFEEAAAEMAPGDLLALFTDGILEAENQAGEAFGDERIAALVAEHRREQPAAVAARLREAVHRFRADGAAADDATLIVLKRPAV